MNEPGIKIFVDCDAMPRPLKEILQKVAQREAIETFFVAADTPRIPPASTIKPIGAGKAFNGADDWIVDHVEAGDLVITADIPLADRAITKGAAVLNTKGEFFTVANIKNAIAMRELLEELRSVGEHSGGPAPFSERQRVAFIDSLNRFLQRRKN